MVKGLKKTISAALAFTTLLSASISAGASGSYKNWLQSDSSWAGKSLGSSGETMAQVGCAVTSIAALAVHSGSVSSDNFDPGVLCDYLSDNGGFDGSANIYWGAVTGLVPAFKFSQNASITGSTKSEITREITALTNAGYYIVLSVDYDTHWVAIDTVLDGEVLMMDPAQNSERKLFNEYSAGSITQARLYKGKNAPSKVDSSSSPVVPDDPSSSFKTGDYRTNSALNFRKGAGTDSDIMAVIPNDTKVTVTAVSGSWGKIEYSGKTGWICLDYADFIGESYKTGYYKVNAEGGVNLREKADGSSKILYCVEDGSEVRVTYVNNGWGRVYYGDYSGFICMDYLKYAGTEPTVTTAATTKPSGTQTTKTTTTAKPVPTIVGDINASGDVTKTDLILLNEYIADPVEMEDELFRIYDVNGDGVIDERDSVYLLKMIRKGQN